jgi:hypothetical protein
VRPSPGAVDAAVETGAPPTPELFFFFLFLGLRCGAGAALEVLAGFCALEVFGPLEPEPVLGTLA